MQDRTGLTVFLVRVVFVLFETRRFCKVARFVFPDLNEQHDDGVGKTVHDGFVLYCLSQFFGGVSLPEEP